jgi:hypothetical protein
MIGGFDRQEAASGTTPPLSSLIKRIKSRDEMSSEDSPKFITPKALSKRWSLSPAATYRLLGSDLPVVKIGRSALRVPIAAVEAYEKRQLGG